MPTPSTSLPNIAREIMIEKRYVHAAMILDGLYLVGARFSIEYSIKDLLEMLSPLGISEKVVRSGTKCPVFRRGYRSTAGRKAFTFRIPTPKQVLTWFMVYDVSEISDVLPIDAFANAASYRKHMHLAMVKRLASINGGKFKMARATMATRLNVCINTIRNYEKNSPIEVIAYISSKVITSAMLWNVPAANQHDHSQWLCIRRDTGETRRYPFIRAIAAMAINAGHMAWHMRQHSNFYSWHDDIEAPGIPKNDVLIE